MVGQDDFVLAWLTPLDSIQCSLNCFKGNRGLVDFIGHQPIDPFDDFFLNGQAVGVKQFGKACPGNSRPDNRSAPFTDYGFEMILSH